MKERLAAALLVLLAWLGWLAFLVGHAPALPVEAGHAPAALRFPSDLDELRAAADLLRAYLSQAPAYVALLFSSAYLFKQTFAVPGSVFLNVLAGAVFGLTQGFVLCCVLTAAGAGLCYALSALCGQALAQRFFPARLEAFKAKLEENRHRLAYFLLFARLFPMSPNWALNMSCGVLGVSPPVFVLTALVGLMPYNFMCVQAGAVLTRLSSLSDVMTWSTALQLSAVACVALLPGLTVKRDKQLELKQ